jgi:hypothetical protein
MQPTLQQCPTQHGHANEGCSQTIQQPCLLPMHLEAAPGRTIADEFSLFQLQHRHINGPSSPSMQSTLPQCLTHQLLSIRLLTIQQDDVC